MSEDARFEDGVEQSISLQALDNEDLSVISSLIQDGIVPVSEISYDPNARRFALLVNRFRWEESETAGSKKRSAERVQSILLFEDVLSAKSSGLNNQDKETIISILQLSFQETSDGSGKIEIILAGDGSILLDVEALDVKLKDVTRPYVAPSMRTPKHPDV